MGTQAVQNVHSDSLQNITAPDWSSCGDQVARAIRSLAHGARRFRASDRGRLRTFIRKAVTAPDPNANCILDNIRLIMASDKEARKFARDFHKYPHVADTSETAVPRVLFVAREYLNVAENFTEETVAAFVQGFERVIALNMGELWGLKPCLQMELVRRLIAAPPESWPQLINSLRRLSETLWKDSFEATCEVDRLLEQDPAKAYSRMDFDSRDRYRSAVGELAKYCPHSEVEVAQAAIELCRKAESISDGSRAAVRRTHVGYYLTDKGVAQLESVIEYRPPIWLALSRFVLRHPTGFYLTSVELLTLFLVFAMLTGLNSLTPIFAGLVLLLLPATQAAVAFINSLVTWLASPRALPKLDLTNAIPDDCLTMVAVPSLLLSESQVHDLVLDLEIRFLANRDPNLYFALLTDAPDSAEAVDQRDGLVDVCQNLIEGLNRRYQLEGCSPFLMLHRHRAYNESEGCWMGWERKRGKLLDLNRLIHGGGDAFPVKVGDTSVLPRVRYVITLDADTQLPRDSAARLIGALAHPLNQAVIDSQSRMVVEGYGILQPRIGISIQSAARSRLARLYSGQTGFDIYTRAISDVYQDLFGEGIFTGKGIYEVETLSAVLDGRFPENALLSHDLIEGAYTRAALVSDVELIDDYPSHFSSYCRRKHRWVRGDWQILRWILSWVPDARGRMIRNPISLISQWKIVDNLRRSLFEPSLLLLLLGGWLYLPQSPMYWTVAAVIVLLIPTHANLLFTLLRAPWGRHEMAAWARGAARAFAEGNITAILSLVFLLHQALLSMDAIARSLGRVFVTRRKLLEWETAAEAETAIRPKATVDVYLRWTPGIAVALSIAVWKIRPAALPAAGPILLLWLASYGVSAWLNRRPRTGRCKLAKKDTQLLRDSADQIYRFFHDWSSPATNWLIPDSVSEDGAAELRFSPTNLGLLLNARVAAVHLGMAPLAEFVFETQQTLDRVVTLTKYRGHLLNWYDAISLEPLGAQFVSTVDSGNLAASLWTLKQAALAFAAEPSVKRGRTEELGEQLHAIAETSDRLVREMDFRFLYDKRRSALSVGYDVAKSCRDVACYDLLASEARIASFVAIAKGDIPQEAWFRLGRTHTLLRGTYVLLSWTGTMFEYLMPVLWMRHYSGTLTERSVRAAIRAQRDHARRKGVPWGISESACLGSSAKGFGYKPFGIPELALKRGSDSIVVSPYSTFLAASLDPAAVLANLRQMEDFGWTGRYGYYEAVEYTRTGAEPVRAWMAHHQGMSLLAITNLLFDNQIQQYFHSEPHVLATELLLHERVPDVAVADHQILPFPELATEPSTIGL
jgi:cyclic beta-1,2-glucan synthetase